MTLAFRRVADSKKVALRCPWLTSAPMRTSPFVAVGPSYSIYMYLCFVMVHQFIVHISAQEEAKMLGEASFTEMQAVFQPADPTILRGEDPRPEAKRPRPEPPEPAADAAPTALEEETRRRQAAAELYAQATGVEFFANPRYFFVFGVCNQQNG